MNYRIELDTSKFESKVAALTKAQIKVGRALYREGNRIITRSKQEFVPVVTGNLRSSGYVELPQANGTEVTVTIGFGGAAAAYAAMVHENPRSGNTGGVSPRGRPYKNFSTVGQWKYLEQPMNEARPGFAGRIAQDVFGDAD